MRDCFGHSVKFFSVSFVFCFSLLSSFLIFFAVLVHSGCYNKNTINWMADNKHLFFTFFEAGKSKAGMSKSLPDSVSSEGPSYGLESAPSSCNCNGRRV